MERRGFIDVPISERKYVVAHLDTEDEVIICDFALQKLLS